MAEARARREVGGRRASSLGLPGCDWDGEVFGAGKPKAAADEVEFALNASDAEAGLVVRERRVVQRASSDRGGAMAEGRRRRRRRGGGG